MNRLTRPGSGWVEVITGSMFSGKSEELIRRIRRAQIARQKVQLFKPRVDDRYADDQIVSHSDMKMPSAGGRAAARDPGPARGPHRGGGDRRGPVLRRRLVEVVNALADRGLRVIVAGLDQDYTGPALRAHAAAAGRRRVRGQDAGHLHALRRPRQPQPAPRGVAPIAWSWAGAAAVRGALPALLPAGPARSEE